MSYFMMLESWFAFVEIDGMLWGLKQFGGRDERLFTIGIDPFPGEQYDIQFQKDYLRIFYRPYLHGWKEEVVLEIHTADLGGVKAKIVTASAPAGMHVSGMLEVEESEPQVWNLPEWPEELSPDVVLVPVSFHIDSIVFTDGDEVSVPVLYIPTVETWLGLKNKMKKTLRGILSRESRNRFEDWYEEIADNLEWLLDKLVEENNAETKDQSNR